MPISAVAADYDLYDALATAFLSDPQDFSTIPHLESYDPENADDNEFIEVIISMLPHHSADDQTSRALLEHICIRSVIVDEVNIIPDSVQNGLLLFTVNHRNHALLQCLAELKFNLGLKNDHGRDAFQGVAEQGVYRVGEKIAEEFEAKDISERESIRIILKSGQTELKSEALIDFVLFGLDRHLISLHENLNKNNLESGENRFEEFFSSKNSRLIGKILDEYSKDAPEKSAAVREELCNTYRTFESTQPSNSPAANSESTRKPSTSDASKSCVIA